MIGSCDCCDRTNVPVSKMVIYGIETTACFVCQSHGTEPDPDPYGEMSNKIPVTYHDLVDRLKECYEQRELPTWGEIHDSAEAIKHLMTLNRLMAPGISERKPKINYEAWARTMIGFIRSKGLEQELTDYAGGWPCPVENKT